MEQARQPQAHKACNVVAIFVVILYCKHLCVNIRSILAETHMITENR